MYCSPTKHLTANARLRWRPVPGPALDAVGGGALAAAGQRLETTVYKNGFDKDLYMS